ncbi:MAG TPA: T9SS type A sorting domain-containing protein [Flavipsychrobacter sp.]|nr:T9SS type A sorting domain-containing protein [Flavipsychrobacter sp.]
MKKLYFLLSALLISLSSFAQADLQILHNLQAGDTIKIKPTNPPQYNFAYGFVNHGPNALTQTDTIFLKTPYQNYFILTLPAAGVPVGDTVFFLDTTGFVTGPASGPYSWCDSIWAKNSSNAIIPDTGMSNNELCTSVQILNLTASISETFGTVPSATVVNLNVYPNPAVSSISFDYSVPVHMPVSVAVYDVVGRKVYQEDLGQQIGSQKKTVNVSNFTNGIYMVELLIDGQKHVGRVLVQK